MAFSWLTFLCLLLIATATFLVTELLSAKWTTYRRYFLLRDFGRSRGMHLVHDRILPVTTPRRIAELSGPPRVRWKFTDGQLTLLRLRTGGDTFNLLLCGVAGNWPATALRSARSELSIVDRLDLFSYPSSFGTERFTLHGQEPSAARRVNESHLRGLLPPDLSVILDGAVMVIDFSARPFDPIELDRMIALGRQVAAAVPPTS